MKTSLNVAVLILIAMLVAPAASAEAGKVEMIFWEDQNWEPGGPRQRLTLWSDGRADITVTCDPAAKLRSGWIFLVDREKGEGCHKVQPISKEEAKGKFAAALAAGIGELKAFPPGYDDGGGTLVGVQIDGKITTTVIPEFLFPGKENNQGSENHKRFLKIEKILGGFETNAVEQ